MDTIIWDWNGTLLNDLDFCISIINVLLKKRQLPLLSKDSYKAVFSFPVKDYYAAIGFDFSKEDFSIPAKEFIDIYDSGVEDCELQNGTLKVLTHFQKKGTRQFVLSAMKQNMLDETLKQNKIHHLFEGVFGLNDHYAVSKIERGKQLISLNNIDLGQTVIIGDTTHDYEVAGQLGIKCILIPDGHQSKERLQKTKALIVDDLGSLIQMKVFT